MTRDNLFMPETKNRTIHLALTTDFNRRMDGRTCWNRRVASPRLSLSEILFAGGVMVKGNPRGQSKEQQERCVGRADHSDR
jgi:hypothetical protein